MAMAGAVADANAAPPTAAGPATGPAAGPAAQPGFEALGLGRALARAAASAGWSVPTPVQAAALPAVLDGRDLLALSPTGSGKTAAFLLPLLQRLLLTPGLAAERPRRLRVLVLAPTREIALQTADAARALLATLGGPDARTEAPRPWAARRSTHS
jgi:superfamily II DNA/RNA helicase